MQINVEMLFRGERDYVAGVDLLEKSCEIAEGLPPHARPTDIRFACYRMFDSSYHQVTVSDKPLSPKEYDVLFQCSLDGSRTFLGWKKQDGRDGRIHVENDEAFLLTHTRIDAPMTVTAVRPQSGRQEIIPMLIAAIKRGCQANFSDVEGKWLFSQANMPHIPTEWQQFKVTTKAQSGARLYLWAVECDNIDLGTITFFAR